MTDNATHSCEHNRRNRYTHGFYCEDCRTFFPAESQTYRSDELLASIWMVLHNINVRRIRNGEAEDPEARTMKDKIGIGVRHKDYEALIAEAEAIMNKHGVTADSATIVLK